MNIRSIQESKQPANTLGPQTRRKVLAHLLVCSGCCCGRTDKGRPAVPVDWLKQEWKRHRLHASVHLSISGCLGPCDCANVVGVLGPNGEVWLGGLDDQKQYGLLLEWAMNIAQANLNLPLPTSLLEKRLDRWRMACPQEEAGQ